jgi:hypothetical protein
VGRRLTVARWLAASWAVFVATLVLSARATVEPDALAFVSTAGLVSVLASVAAAVVVRRSPQSAGALLVVAALSAPTFGAVWLNAVPLVMGILVLRDGRPRSATDLA